MAVMSSPLCIRKGAQVSQSPQSSIVWLEQAYKTLAHCSVVIPTSVYGLCRSLRGRATQSNLCWLTNMKEEKELLL